MTTNVITVKSCTTREELAKILATNKISGVPVMDDEGCCIIGIVTEADLLTKSGATVGEIMTKEVVSVCEDTPIEEIAKILAEKGIKRVPVVKEGKLVGIVSRADIVKAFAGG
ncbi:CBS domain-containing protein [bacterium]|nr:CBS domain-containing protein [bacterium]